MATPRFASPDEVIAATRAWIERAVIGLDLCPFAKSVYVKDQIRYVVSQATHATALVRELKQELGLLAAANPQALDTTLLIHPLALTAFLDYNDFIGVADAAIAELGLARVLQLATFHPAYQFAGSAKDDIANYTNRSPYPMLQLLREASLDRAVAALPGAHHIYQKNIATMRRLGPSGWEALGLSGPDGRESKG